MNNVDAIIGEGWRKTIAVDFDGVIHDQNPDPGRKMGRPLYYAKEALTEMKNNGYRIIIFSARVQSERDKLHIADWMQYFQIPYDEIALTKPKAILYIDDHAYRFTDWMRFLQDITRLL